MYYNSCCYAAILQQTAEYIYSLEQEKTRLLSQNCQLKRTIDQQDHNGAPELAQNAAQIVTGSTANGGVVVSQQQQLVSNAGTGGSGQPGTVVATVAKKRKIDVTTQPVSDSSDEGLGSMSPEPVSLRAVNVTSNGSNLSNVHSGTTTISSPSTHGRQCTTVNFSAKDYLELKHQLEVERRQKQLIEDRLKALERQVYPTRIQYQDASELIVPDLINEPSSVSLAPEEVAVSIIHKPVSSGTPVSGKLTRVPTELEGGMLLISQDANSLAKNQHIVVCSNELMEEAHTMQTVPAAPKQLVIPLKDEKLYIKRSRSRSPTVGEATVVTLPPKKNRYPSILEAAIKAEPKVEVERIDSPSSIVEVPLALTTASKQQTPLMQTKIDRDHRQSQLEPYLKFRTAPNASASAVLPTTANASNLAATASSVVTLTPQVGSIISVSIAPTGSNSLPAGSSCHSPAAVAAAVAASASASATATTTIVANSSVVSANMAQTQHPNALTAAAQLLQQQQQCRPGVIVVKQNS
uniref:BHLH domain-containing protein n=1 Tax=Anopheles maculatus TaxID=74869 RepID=A0A182T211_9DIPT